MSSYRTSLTSDISVDLNDAFQNIILNKRFAKWDDFDSALKEFQKTTHTHYIHTESQLLKDVRFKYLFVTFHCTCGCKRKSKGLAMNPKPSKFLNCQSRFRVRLEAEGYVIKSYKMLHNHPCSSLWMICDPWSRRLSSEEKENLMPVILQSQSTDELIEIIKDRTGKQLTVADVKILKAKLSTDASRRTLPRCGQPGSDNRPCTSISTQDHCIHNQPPSSIPTAHQIFRHCSRWRLENTQNLQNI